MWGGVGGGAKQKQSDKIMLVTIKNPKGAPAAPLSPPNFSGVGTALVALPWVPHSAPTHGAEPPPMHGRDKPSIPPSIPGLELNGSNTNVITGSSSRVSQVTHPRAGGCSTEPRPPPGRGAALSTSPPSSHFCALFLSFPLNPLLGSARGLGRRGVEEEEGNESKTEVRCGVFCLAFFFWGGGGEGGREEEGGRPDTSPMSISLRSVQVGQP